MILEDLKYDMVTLLRQFKENLMKANPKKIQLIILGKKRQDNLSCSVQIK